MNGIAKAYLAFYPEPTNPTATINNFVSSPNTVDNYSNEMGRIDYNMSSRSRFFADVRHTDYAQSKNNYFNNVAEGSLLYRANLGLAADEVLTLNATDVIDIRLNFTRMNEGHNMPSVGFNPTSLGFPSSVAGNSTYLQMPIIAFNSATGLQNLSAPAPTSCPPSPSSSSPPG